MFVGENQIPLDAAWRARAFDAVLEAVASAAFVLDEQGAVRQANVVGRAWLEEEPAARAGQLRAAVTSPGAVCEGNGAALPPSARQSMPRPMPQSMGGATLRITRIAREPERDGALYLAILESPAESMNMLAARPADPGTAGLTARERDVLDLLAHGATYDEIARMLGIATNTVRSHVRSLYEKLGASSKTEALREGVRLGYVTLAGFRHVS